MYSYDQIKSVHLEVTEKCQSGCALCGRYDKDGNLNQNLKLSELSLADVRKIFPKEFVKQLDRIYMCGNFGDPIVAQDTLEIFEYFRYSNVNIGLDMHTNGGARSSQWWKDLASIFYNQKSHVTFSIDGLQDTNHIYRRGVVWDNIVNAATSFIGAGGTAHWNFIVFKHNEHQVEQARELADKLGFKKFVAKKSARFSNYRSYDYLLPPTNPNYLNLNVKLNQHIDQTYGSYQNFLDKTPINCRVKRQKEIYISAEGLVLPCCWTAGALYNKSKITESEIFKVIKNIDAIDAKKSSIKQVIDSGIFNQIEKTWSQGSMSEGRLDTCARYCSKEYDFFADQFTQ